jgi:hypothetical protein
MLSNRIPKGSNRLKIALIALSKEKEGQQQFQERQES